MIFYLLLIVHDIVMTTKVIDLKVVELSKVRPFHSVAESDHMLSVDHCLQNDVFNTSVLGLHVYRK